MEDKPKRTSEGQHIRCKAAVCRKPGEPLSIEEIIVAPPMPREARIRIICTSLCHSDVTFWKLQDPPAIFPRILGHEAIGVVESVGENVTEVTKGDVVMPIFLPDCGECIDCKSSKSNFCSKFPFKVSPWMPRYATSRFTDLKGEIIHHFLFISSFSEYTVVDIANLNKIIDPKIPPSMACLFSCGVSTGSNLFSLMTDGGADYCFECVGMASLVHEAYASCRKVFPSLSPSQSVQQNTSLHCHT
ncbi:hypothetical protein RIF29_17720 [Crotalaria pallida]|uniref:Alcohol dehydrogenase-like N-terminal domain-containing protein n=1 Tax=Crotalaria pallida TaxID=3830 RepID=A0AAN9IET3_CROPI